MIFAMKAPGQISVRFNFIGTNYIPTPGATNAESAGAANANVMEENVVEARWAAFEELVWMYKGQTVKLEFMVRHYMTQFIRESSK